MFWHLAQGLCQRVRQILTFMIRLPGTWWSFPYKGWGRETHWKVSCQLQQRQDLGPQPKWRLKVEASASTQQDGPTPSGVVPAVPSPAQLDIQALPAAYHTTPVATQPEVPVPAPPAKASLPRSVAIAKTNSKWHNGVCSLQGKVHHQPCRQPQEGDQAFHVNSRVNHRAVVTRWWVGQGDHEAQRHQDLSRIKDAASASTHSLLKTSLAWQETQLKTLHNELFEVKAKVGCEFAASRSKSRRCSEQLTRVARRISVWGTL